MLKVDDQNMKKYVENARQFAVDYDPLEYLLIGLIDAQPNTTAKREKRLQIAYEAITGRKRKRVDEPDSEIAKAMFEAIKEQGIDYFNQLKPEFSDEKVRLENQKEEFDSRKDNKIAQNISEKFDDMSGNLQDNIYRRMRVRQPKKIIQHDPNGYYNAIWARYALYDECKEKKLKNDMIIVAEILAKHGVELCLDPAFWRVSDG